MVFFTNKKSCFGYGRQVEQEGASKYNEHRRCGARTASTKMAQTLPLGNGASSWTSQTISRRRQANAAQLRPPGSVGLVFGIEYLLQISFYLYHFPGIVFLATSQKKTQSDQKRANHAQPEHLISLIEG
ncbi:MAG TPA: hypothetical protein VFE62_12860 [Gemmataceae bacterium]|nr:hypothetical protein [Gemmataceae bacterium]